MKARVALVAMAVLAASAAFAHERHHGPDMERMAVLLDLNDTQKVEVEKILREQHERVRTLHQERRSAGAQPTREERMKVHQELKQETLGKLQSVLTPEQIKKFEVLTERPHRRQPSEQ